MIGRRFGRLVVLCREANASWVCKCDCGATKVAREYRLKSGATASCGCLRTEMLRKRTTTHGKTGSKTHRVWLKMRERCESPNDVGFARYGGRGITVCERWRDFRNFYADMGDAPTGMMLERVDNDGNYEPGNCRWATKAEQCRNTRRTRLLTYRGTTLPMIDLAAKAGIKYKTVADRINKHGWTVEDALETPIGGKRK